MKRMILQAICLFICLSSFAQTDSSHLCFDGIPIDGTLSSFVSRMQEKGYRQTQKKKLSGQDTAMMRGRFASIKGSFIIGSVQGEEDLVYQVIAMFAGKDWSDLLSRYRRLKDELFHVYGAPVKCIEGLHPNSLSNDNVSGMQHNAGGKYIYIALFETPQGSVFLRVIRECGCVVAVYNDDINRVIADSVRRNRSAND